MNKQPESPASVTSVGVPLPSPGSASEIVIASLTGKPLRKLSRQRLLKTGDKLSNIHGQELWEVVACHPLAVRVMEWPHGVDCDYTWEALYRGFYERVPADDPTLQNTMMRDTPPPANQSHE